MRWVAALVLSASALIDPMGGPAAWAEDDRAAARRAVELAWLEGRVESLEAVLRDGLTNELTRAFEGVWPLSLRDGWWRRGGPDHELVMLINSQSGSPESHVFAPHARWLDADHLRGPHRPFPGVADGGEDPYPILTALIRDRERRETRGHVGLPEESPIVLLAPHYDPETQEALHYYLDRNTRYWMNLAYKGYAEDEYSRKLERSAAALEARNGAWALWSLVLFILIPVLGSLWLGRKRA